MIDGLDFFGSGILLPCRDDLALGLPMGENIRPFAVNERACRLSLRLEQAAVLLTRRQPLRAFLRS